MLQEKSAMRAEIAHLLLVVLAVLGFFFEMMVSPEIPLFRDLGPIFYPMRFSLAESLRAGELPLWDRHVAMGYPLLANFQSGTFYPPHLLYLFLPLLAALKINFLFHAVVAAVGAYVLARQWDHSRPAAALFAVSFALGGCMVSMLNLLNHFQSAVWLPWVISLGERQLVSPRRKPGTLWVVVAALQLLAGSPEIYGMSMLLHCANSLRVSQIHGVSRARILSSFLWVNLLVAGLALVQILPTLELLRETGRLRTSSFAGTTVWSLHPGSLLNLLLLEREVGTGSFATFRSFLGLPAPFFMSLYMGAIFPFGLRGWLSAAPGREKIAVSLGVLVSLCLAMGHLTPLYEWFYDSFPLAFLMRFPEKWFFVTFALLAYVTAAGIHVWLDEGGSAKRLFLGPLLGCALIAGWAAGLRYSESFFPASLRPEDVSALVSGAERQVFFWLCLGALFWLWRKACARKTLLELAFMALIAFDLYGAHRPYLFLTGDEVLRRPPEILTYVDPSAGERIFFASAHSWLHPIAVLFPGARSPAENIVFGVQSLRPNTGRLWGAHYLQDIDALARDSYDHLRAGARHLEPRSLFRLLGNLHVGYLISQQPLPEEGIYLLRHFPQFPLWLYRIANVAPQVIVASRAIAQADPVLTLARLAESDFEPTREVFLEQPLLLSPDGDLKAEAKITTATQTLVRIRASLSRPGVMVLAESFYPGWKAFVNGQEQEILRANYFFRAVTLGAGNHEVVFTYAPDSLRYGVAGSLAAVGVMLALALKTPAAFARERNAAGMERGGG